MQKRNHIRSQIDTLSWIYSKMAPQKRLLVENGSKLTEKLVSPKYVRLLSFVISPSIKINKIEICCLVHQKLVIKCNGDLKFFFYFINLPKWSIFPYISLRNVVPGPATDSCFVSRKWWAIWALRRCWKRKARRGPSQSVVWSRAKWLEIIEWQ